MFNSFENIKVLILVGLGAFTTLNFVNIVWLVDIISSVNKYDDFYIPGLNNFNKTIQIYESGFDWSGSPLCPNYGKNLKLFVFVLSAPGNFEWRESIRKTWGTCRSIRGISLGFLIGSTDDPKVTDQLQTENRNQKDLILAKFHDSYYNLSLKTISMLEWADKKCSNTKFILKIDDDVFLNIRNLLKLIERHQDVSRRIFGEVLDQAVVFRDRKSKYYVQPTEYEPAVFPQYTAGPAYLITTDIVHDLFIKAMETPFFKFEDVYVTGFLASVLLDVFLEDSEGFISESYQHVLNDTCFIKNTLISYHKCEIKCLHELWNKTFSYRDVKCP